jgi:hypothetical protein
MCFSYFHVHALSHRVLSRQGRGNVEMTDVRRTNIAAVADIDHQWHQIDSEEMRKRKSIPVEFDCALATDRVMSDT